MNALLGRVVGVGLALASIAVLAMMTIGAADIVATLLKLPIPGAKELMEMLMVLVVFLALADVEYRRNHIAIDMLAEQAAPRGRRLLGLVGTVLGLGFYGAMAWQAWKLFWSSWTIREYATGLVAFPVYPTKLLFALGVTVVGLAALANLVRSLRASDLDAASGGSAAPDPEKEVL